jgi:hypothetical protein
VSVRFVALVTALLALFGLAQGAPADAYGRDSGQTKVFSDVYVSPGETVEGDVNVVFGDVTVAGVVTGDCNTIFGQCGVVDGGVVRGKINSFNNDGVRAFVPWAVTRDHGFGLFAEQDHRLVSKLLSSAIVILVFLLFPLRMRVALARVERHPALSAATGAIAAVALVPIAILLLVSIIGIPLIALEIAAVFAGVWIGTGAIALLVGRRLCELVMPMTTPSPLVALILGLVAVSAAEITPLIGWAVTALVWLVGLGSAILAFIRASYLDAPPRRTPIAGPAGGPGGWR